MLECAQMTGLATKPESAGGRRDQKRSDEIGHDQM
jgi:hypothetical protein